MSRRPMELVEVDTSKLDDVLRRAEQSLDPDDYELTQAIFESYAYLADLVEDKNTSIRRLRQLLFGNRSEKTSSVMDDSDAGAEGDTDPQDDTPADQDLESVADDPREDGQSPNTSDSEDDKPAGDKGHGRNGASAYRGGEQIEVSHDCLKAGDPCPECQQGTLYNCPPRVLVRIVGQAPLHSRVYELQRLRCHLCGKVFTAEAPADAGAEKYDATAATMIALLKYGSGLPFNRLESLQRNLEIPLPASTQWDVVHAHVPPLVPPYEELLRQAAQGDVLHNDDTTVKILEAMKQNRASAMNESQKSRTGLFTSGIVATRDGRRVALFFSGRQHAGENLADVLKHRAAELARPIQMCDALSRNLTGDLQTIVANCLAHARRQFVDIHDRFPDECRYVLEALNVIYRNDSNARKKGLSPEQRLCLGSA